MTNPDVLTLLTQPIAKLPGIAKQRQELLARLGIVTCYDLLTWFPRGFENWNEHTPLTELTAEQVAVFTARVARKPALQRKGKLTILRTWLSQDGGRLQAVWFNQPWLETKLSKDQMYVFRGKIKKRGSSLSVQNPEFEACDQTQEPTGKVLPVYPLTQGLSQNMMRKIVESLLPRVIGQLPEPLPADIRRKQGLCAVDFAYSRMHRPQDLKEAEICRRRLIFEELFLLLAAIHLLRQTRQRQMAALPVSLSQSAADTLQAAQNRLPFDLTQAQRQSLAQIETDLAAPLPMNRLLQGDVGSGKTVVAALAMLRCALSGRQAVLMAPTAVLARQHHQTLSELLHGCGQDIGLLTGSTKKTERLALLSRLQKGDLKLLVGTHALIEEGVEFSNLALAITDEQHRFGVRQRIRLARQRQHQNLSPHVLVMSATPIPRTLALILYGDLDISVIDQLPAGRRPIRTYTARSRDLARVDELIRRRVEAKEQVYVVCPMIEESAQSDLESAVSVYERLGREVVSSKQTGLLHGRLKAREKEEVMDRFLRQEIKVLVSTTVIEVGVDNPNATLMLIINAERFGLAQLHQLRGRVGRGDLASLCVLMSDAQDELARARLKALCQSTDGFVLAEKDLSLRGPGDFFGTRQHGLPPLRLANLYEDIEWLQRAKDSLKELTKQDPQLKLPQHQVIREVLQARYGDTFTRVGL